MICWKCHEPVGGAVCPGCGAVQPLRGEVDFFDILGLARRYHLDLDALEAAWRERSRRVHPDRFAGRPAVERRMALQWTAALNEARRVLRDPLRRAQYLATGRAEPDERDRRPMDPAFLEAVFELQLAAEADPEAARERARAMRAEVEAELDELFARWERGEAELDRDAATDLLGRLRTLDNAIAQAGG